MDTSVLLNVKDMVKQGHRKMFIQTVDIDVLVLAVQCMKSLKMVGSFRCRKGKEICSHLRKLPTHR